MKVYLDVCCLCRLFDDQSQDKVRRETEAIERILKRCANGDWDLVGSDIITLETTKNPDTVKRQKILRLHDGAVIKVKHSPAIKLRAEQFRKHGVKLFDSWHMASAEYAEANVLLTTDKQFINASGRSDVKIWVTNPVTFCMEVLGNE